MNRFTTVSLFFFRIKTQFWDKIFLMKVIPITFKFTTILITVISFIFLGYYFEPPRHISRFFYLFHFVTSAPSNLILLVFPHIFWLHLFLFSESYFRRVLFQSRTKSLVLVSPDIPCPLLFLISDLFYDIRFLHMQQFKFLIFSYLPIQGQPEIMWCPGQFF